MVTGNFFRDEGKTALQNFLFSWRQNQGFFIHNLRFFGFARAFSGVASVDPGPHETGVNPVKTTLSGITMLLHKLQQTELVSKRVAWLGSVQATG